MSSKSGSSSKSVNFHCPGTNRKRKEVTPFRVPPQRWSLVLFPQVQSLIQENERCINKIRIDLQLSPHAMAFGKHHFSNIKDYCIFFMYLNKAEVKTLFNAYRAKAFGVQISDEKTEVVAATQEGTEDVENGSPHQKAVKRKDSVI